MSDELLPHREFWTQFEQYLADREVPIRLGKSQASTSSVVGLGRSLFNLIPWRLLKGNQAGVWIRFNSPDGVNRYELCAQRYRAQIETTLSGLGLDWQSNKRTIQLS